MLPVTTAGKHEGHDHTVEFLDEASASEA